MGTVSVADSLAQARHALERDDETGALSALLEAWGTTRAEALADLVALQSALLGHLVDAGYASKTASTFPFWQCVFDAVLEQDDLRLLGPLAEVQYTHIYRFPSDAKKRIPWFQERVENTARVLRDRHPKGLAKLPVVVGREAASLNKLLKSRPVVSERARASLALVAQPPPERKTVKRTPKAESGSTLEALDRAEGALGRGDFAAGLDALLVAWRITPALVIAELASVASRRIEVQLELANARCHSAQA